ncbi:DNA cytosine methyltransferase [Luteolibacter flavescens]|uniref:DNA cytosine methyltransferase n=1 Tax=Luteolibacter flavescens TaxID=1859460 RepID=A0ABT3FWR6_9BACT|nr:DNA cytosine methyltransferase [Luteolibacter flavescens]MCW1887691.1 DNA cytosine methyltransferase [Luteolibacter flavescens]
MNYYNEHDPKAAAWLRELIAQGHIPAGDVDERSIIDVRPHELTRYTQQHFFAGIGGWSLALRLAGWPDDRPVRTGSCPCQPFSQAGRGLGTKDARHLWPVFRDLITFGDPTVTFGEQVASKAGRDWLAGVRADLEGLGYAVGAADLCAAGVGAPHIRQRIFWLADPCRQHQPTGSVERRSSMVASKPGGTKHRGTDSGLGHTDSQHAGRHAGASDCPEGKSSLREGGDSPCTPGADGRLGDSSGYGLRGSGRPSQYLPHQPSHWSLFDLISCADGKARRIEPGSFPLAHGVPARVGRLRGYGNAIIPQAAAEFIGAWLDLSTFP